MIYDISLNQPAAIHCEQAAPPAFSPLLASILKDLHLCTSTLLATIPDGPKTLPMLEDLETGSLVHYRSDTQTLLHKGISFQVLKGSNENISQHPIVCIGSDPTGREVISLDPKNSPILERKYQELLAILKNAKSNLSLSTKLQFISTYVREEIFSSDISEEQLSSFIRKWQKFKMRTKDDFTLTKNRKYIPVIPIDDFIKHRTGLCRHQALVTAYILDRLTKEENDILPPGKSYYVRDVVSTGSSEGGHAWNLFVPDNSPSAWHVDSLWNVVKDCSDQDDWQFLTEHYGEGAILREKQRFITQL